MIVSVKTKVGDGRSQDLYAAPEISAPESEQWAVPSHVRRWRCNLTASQKFDHKLAFNDDGGDDGDGE